MVMNLNLILIVVALLAIVSYCHIQHHTPQQIQEKIDKTKIMYGATIRIKAVMFSYQ
jgi:hypothetical protein